MKWMFLWEGLITFVLLAVFVTCIVSDDQKALPKRISSDTEISLLYETSENLCESKCLNGGTCTTDNGTPRCICTVGYSGANCDTDLCESKCLNGGTCTTEDGTPRCVCPVGYSGANCDTDLCESKCLNGGTCTTEDGTPRCICHVGYSGANCDTDLCESKCLNGGTCTTEDGTPRCVCPVGYSGANCDTDLCESKCLNGGTCTTEDGTPRCICPVGYSGANCDTDLCQTKCLNGGTCSTENGIVKCVCPAGYSGENCDTDLCESKCLNGGTCTTEDGTPRCICPVGYSGANCDTDLCQTKCLNGGTCSTEDGTVKCICPARYSGTNCDTDLCESKCLNGGTCTTEDGTPRCICPVGYSGANCDTDLCQSKCINGGTCIITDDGIPKCKCPDGYTGENCDKEICPREKCNNRGNCTKENGRETCACDKPYKGLYCEIDPCESKSPCQNGGTCYIEDEEMKCKCTTYYGGMNCDIKIDECALMLVKGECNKLHETCANGKCDCEEHYAYSGDDKSCIPNFCGKSNGKLECQLNAVCKEIDNRYECECQKGYYPNGEKCEKPNFCSPGVSKCTQLCDFNTGVCSCVDGFKLDDDGFTCNPDGNLPSCSKDCGAGTCIKKGSTEECICSNVTHVPTSKGCEDYCTNKRESPKGMCPENKCESYGDGFRCNCTNVYEQDEDRIHCRRKAMCRDGGGNEMCSNKNERCEEVLSDTKTGYKCECKQEYERDGNGACISKCDKKNCKEKNAECQFYGDDYTAVCKCPLMMTFVNDKCSKLAEHSYVGQFLILKRRYKINSVSESSKRSTDYINDKKLRSDIEESLKYVYDDYQYSNLLNCTDEGEILNCNLELQFKKKMEKEELRTIADPSKCIPLQDTDYCWIKPILIMKRIEKKEIFHPTDPCTPLIRSTVCGSMTTCKQVESKNAFTCTCKKGFRSINTFKPTISDDSLVHTCEDIDECLDEKICPNTTNCKNTFGSYECLCKIGHYKESESNTKTDGCLAVCDPSPCVHGKCEKVGDHGFACSCDGDYTGVYCNVTNDVVVKAKKAGRTNAAVVGGVLGAILVVILIGGYLFIRKLKKSKGDEHEYMQPRKRGALSEMRLGKRQTERDDDIELRQSGRRPVRPLPERQDRRDSGEFRRGFGGSTSMMPRAQNSGDEYEEEESVRRPLPERRDNTELGKNRMIPRPRLTRSEDQYDEIHQTRDERPRRHFTKSSESLPQDDKKITSLQYKNKAYEDD